VLAPRQPIAKGNARNEEAKERPRLAEPDKHRDERRDLEGNRRNFEIHQTSIGSWVPEHEDRSVMAAATEPQGTASTRSRPLEDGGMRRHPRKTDCPTPELCPSHYKGHRAVSRSRYRHRVGSSSAQSWWSSRFSQCCRKPNRSLSRSHYRGHTAGIRAQASDATLTGATTTNQPPGRGLGRFSRLSDPRPGAMFNARPISEYSGRPSVNIRISDSHGLWAHMRISEYSSRPVSTRVGRREACRQKSAGDVDRIGIAARPSPSSNFPPPRKRTRFPRAKRP
jgi:hypothetical protein